MGDFGIKDTNEDMFDHAIEQNGPPTLFRHHGESIFELRAKA